MGRHTRHAGARARVEVNPAVFSNWLHRGAPGSILGVYNRSRRIARNASKRAKRHGRTRKARGQ